MYPLILNKIHHLDFIVLLDIMFKHLIILYFKNQCIIMKKYLNNYLNMFMLVEMEQF